MTRRILGALFVGCAIAAIGWYDELYRASWGMVVLFGGG